MKRLTLLILLIYTPSAYSDEKLDKAVQKALSDGRHAALAKDGLMIKVTFVPVTQLNKNEMMVNSQPSAFTPAPAETKSVITGSPVMSRPIVRVKAQSC